MDKFPNEDFAGSCHRNGFADKLVLVLSAICTISMLARVAWYSHFGFDLTDESYYLVWISNPFNYTKSDTQFGFVYHPLYLLVSGNIAALRQCNFLITFLLSWQLCDVFLRKVLDCPSLRASHRLVVSAAIGTVVSTSLVKGGCWLPTPSYNSLALQALLIAATGMLIANEKQCRASGVGYFFIGTGGWLAFMAKPTTAAALGVVVFFYLLFAGKLRIRLLAFSIVVAIGFTFLSALVIDGSAIGFLERLKGGFELDQSLGVYSLTHMLRPERFHLGGRGILTIGAVAMLSSLASMSYAENKAMLKWVGLFLLVVFACVILAIEFGVIHNMLMVGRDQGLLVFAIPIASMLLMVIFHRRNGQIQPFTNDWPLATSFLLFPYVFAFGTNTSKWMLGSQAAVFWILSGLTLLMPAVPGERRLRILLPLGFAVQLVTVVLVQSGIHSPFRQPQPLWMNDYTLEIGAPGSVLNLSKDFGVYLSRLRVAANTAGYKKGDPVIDLSGMSPGVLYALDANSLGQAWIIGGYPGSNEFAASALKDVPCEQLAVAWLLVEPGSPKSISPNILTSFGAKMGTDFAVVATLKASVGLGGTGVRQFLKPVRPINSAIEACKSSRAAGQ